MGGECVQRHDGLWRWRVIGPGGKVEDESKGLFPTKDACLANARANAVGWDAPSVERATTSADQGERRDMSIRAGRGRKGVAELVDHVGRIVTETGRPVRQIDGHAGSSVSQAEGFAISVMREALDAGVVVASPDHVMEFFGGTGALANVDLTEAGWALYAERSASHPAAEVVSRDQVDAPALASPANTDAPTSTGIEIHANEVNIGTAVGGDVAGGVDRSRVSSVASGEPFWKAHRRKALWVLLLAALAIAGEEFIIRAVADLYDRFFATVVSTPQKGNVKGIYSMSQDEYDALEEKEPDTRYVITHR